MFPPLNTFTHLHVIIEKYSVKEIKSGYKINHKMNSKKTSTITQGEKNKTMDATKCCYKKIFVSKCRGSKIIAGRNAKGGRNCHI